MNEKIIQIIPAPAGMSAIFEDSACDNGICQCRTNKNHTAHLIPTTCLALVELESGEREVWSMITDNAGCIVWANDSDGYLGIDYK